MWFWRTLGAVSFALGAIGLVLPVWPTTVFWIVAAIAFAKSDPHWRDWIYARPGAGPIIESFIESGTLSRSAKVAALTGMTLAAGLIWLTLSDRPWPLRIALGLLAFGAAYVVTRKRPA